MCVRTQVLMHACQYMCRRYTHISGVHVFILISSKYRTCVCACVFVRACVVCVETPPKLNITNCQEVLKACAVFEYCSIL